MERKNNSFVTFLEGVIAFLVAVALPVYIIADNLVVYAIHKDNSKSLFCNKKLARIFNWAESFKEKVDKIRPSKKEKVKELQGISYDKCTEIQQIGVKWFLAQEPEEVTIVSQDGLKLKGYFLPADKPTGKVVIMMHGYRCNRFNDFANLLQFYHDQGYNILHPDERSHGASEGNYISFGVNERYDLLEWSRYIVNRFYGECEIVLTGVSMGASTVLMASELDLPRQVKGIIADCGFTSAREEFEHVICHDFHLPAFPFVPVADFICQKRAGFGFNDASTIRALKKCKLPVLLFHGERDHFVPVEMSYRNYDACAAQKELVIIDRAAHATSNVVNPELYRSKIKEFLKNL